MRALVSKCGTAMAPFLIFAALGTVLSTRCPTPASDAASIRFDPSALRFEDPQETALLLADAPRTRATAGAERNDARSGSSLAKEFEILRMQASARPRLASAGLSPFVCR